jgi:hypothetical protein
MARQRHDPDPVGDYLAGARERLAACGNEFSEHSFACGPAIVGLQSSVHTLGKADLFTVLVHPRQPVTPDLLGEFVHDASRYAEANRGGTWRTRGLAVLPIVVSEQVGPEARADALARKPSKVGVARPNSGTFRWPAVVDVATGDRLYYTGWFWVGRFGSEWIRERLLLAMGPRRVA